MRALSEGRSRPVQGRLRLRLAALRHVLEGGETKPGHLPLMFCPDVRGAEAPVRADMLALEQQDRSLGDGNVSARRLGNGAKVRLSGGMVKQRTARHDDGRYRTS